MLLQNVGLEKIENSRGICKIVSNQRRYIYVYILPLVQLVKTFVIQ